MNKRVCFLFLLGLVLCSLFAAAANDTTTDIQTKAYACLGNKVNGHCSSLSTEEKIFSLLSIGQCKSELLSDSFSTQCWPEQKCTVKSTAQAILALSKAGIDTSKAETWLLSQSINSKDIDWFLQVEANTAAGEETSCSVAYSDNSIHHFSINEDKTLSGDAGNCLSVYQDYWFKVSSSCYNEQFKVSCSDSFQTSVLYQKTDAGTNDFYVSDKTASASGEGTTTENINLSCFKTGSVCDYEGTLWAAIVLKYLKYDVSSYIPYLIAMSGNNPQYIPESFLYTLTDNFRTDLLTRQQENQWWAASGDKFYDTAVALLPFQNEDITEKANSKAWLSGVQGADGCWQDNIRNTAFILYSLWTKNINVTVTQKNCESSNHFCMSSASCSGISGTELTDYSQSCLGTNICCDRQKVLASCSAQGGKLCSSGEQCLGGSDIDASDSLNSICCVSGTCGVQQQTACSSSGGICRDSCFSTEQFSSSSCSSSQVCCVSSSASQKSSGSLVIILLVILIVLALAGIIFRKKLRELFLKFKFGGGKGKAPTTPSPRFPPTSSSRVYPGLIPRTIIPQRAPATRAPVRKPAGRDEVSDVLKKLKDIGK
ncbi:Uncharacterised protein [uncultured archaeon]|nr:Uncharacterised protein [uncultured archaeon]